MGNKNLIRVAVAPEPREAIPLQGTWFGTAADHLAMKVAVKVTAAAAAGAGIGTMSGPRRWDGEFSPRREALARGRLDGNLR